MRLDPPSHVLVDCRSNRGAEECVLCVFCARMFFSESQHLSDSDLNESATLSEETTYSDAYHHPI